MRDSATTLGREDPSFIRVSAFKASTGTTCMELYTSLVGFQPTPKRLSGRISLRRSQVSYYVVPRYVITLIHVVQYNILHTTYMYYTYIYYSGPLPGIEFFRFTALELIDRQSPLFSRVQGGEGPLFMSLRKFLKMRCLYISPWVCC